MDSRRIVLRKTLQSEIATDVQFETFVGVEATPMPIVSPPAEQLGDKVRTIRERQGKNTRIIVIGHSHGGSIALLSLHFAQPDSLVCISTPFIVPKRRFSLSVAINSKEDVLGF